MPLVRLLVRLVVASLLLPFVTGTLAVLLKFGDPWGMGNDDPRGVFIGSALPFLSPGVIQLAAWPLTFGVALLLSPLALAKRPALYAAALFVYLGALVGGWLLTAALAPDALNALDGGSLRPGRLNGGLRKAQVFLLADTAVLSGTALFWLWRRARDRTPAAGSAPATP